MVEPGDYQVRRARANEVERLIFIEDAAGVQYGAQGIASDLPGLSPAQLESAIERGHVWVLATPDDEAQAFALVQPRPHALHLREIDVHPDHARRRLGQRLLVTVREHAQQLGLPAITLTTFRDVPFNGPLYERYGFERLARPDQPAWLRAIRDEEDAGPLGQWPRIAMRMVVDPDPAS